MRARAAKKETAAAPQGPIAASPAAIAATPKRRAGEGRWAHRLAWALAGFTFPLIWFGGMVTTWRAGMAVPDWPSSFQHWLFLPFAQWFSTWHVVLEHTHREIGKVVGLLTIGLLVALWRTDDRRWIRVLGTITLLAVCYQGVLGGLRVVANEVVMANLHGCTAPLFFALAAAMVTFTSPGWRTLAPQSRASAATVNQLWRLTWIVPAATYVQIVFGAQIRHLLPESSVWWFPWFVWLHLINVALITAGLVWLGKIVFGDLESSILRRRTVLLIALMAVQVLLGLAAWVTKYGWPDWAARHVGPWDYTVSTGGLVQGLMVTSHVAVGSLAFVAALSLALWSRRLVKPAAGAGSAVPVDRRSDIHRAESAGSSASQRGSGRDLLRVYWQLVRPRIVSMVLFTMVVAALVAARGRPAWKTLLPGLAGSSLVIIGAVAFNQRIEHLTDALMARTARRPLPTRRLTPGEVTWFGLLTSLAGIGLLAGLGNPVNTILAALSWVIYVVIYTPIKPHSTWQTPIGAVTGAMPILLGAAAAGQPWDFSALVLFAILYFWQFPHAMAIAWLYRREFAAAHLKLLTVTEPSGRRAGWLGVAGALLLLGVSLVPAMAGPRGWSLSGLAIILALVYLAASIEFLKHPDDRRARRLLRVSLLYLMILFVAFLIGALA